MKIKDKITPELKDDFREFIQKTLETGKEQGSILCLDEKGKFYAPQRCQGEECGMSLKVTDVCKTTVGNFHTHPISTNFNKGRINRGERPLSTNEIKAYIRNINKRQVPGIIEIHPNTPSKKDVLSTYLWRCSGRRIGTVCIGSDVEKDNVECWTVKKISDNECLRAVDEFNSIRNNTEEGGKPPGAWMVPLFDIERINLKKSLLERISEIFR